MSPSQQVAVVYIRLSKRDTGRPGTADTVYTNPSSVSHHSASDGVITELPFTSIKLHHEQHNQMKYAWTLKSFKLDTVFKWLESQNVDPVKVFHLHN